MYNTQAKGMQGVPGSARWKTIGYFHERKVALQGLYFMRFDGPSFFNGPSGVRDMRFRQRGTGLSSRQPIRPHGSNRCESGPSRRPGVVFAAGAAVLLVSLSGCKRHDPIPQTQSRRAGFTRRSFRRSHRKSASITGMKSGSRPPTRQHHVLGMQRGAAVAAGDFNNDGWIDLCHQLRPGQTQLHCIATTGTEHSRM